MRSVSPLRYPGGKTALAELLGNIRRLNGLGAQGIAEPFAGGAGASLALLFLEETQEIHINDADPSIYAFWWTITHQPSRFRKLLSGTRVNMTEWRRQRLIYRSSGRVSGVRRGFAAFYLNRCNRSGIIMNGGPIGGVEQDGPWKLNARFNKTELQRRCDKVAEYADRVNISCTDGIEFITQHDSEKTFLFVDPPYYVKGQTLYLNALNADYHESLAKSLRGLKKAAWVLTYDDCPEVRALYRDWAAIRPFSLRYVASDRRMGREILITPKWMRLPSAQSSTQMKW